MKGILIAIIVTAIVCIGGTSVWFFWQAMPSLSQATQNVNQLLNNNGIIITHFNSIANLEGYVVEDSQTGAQSLLYADKQGRYLISGVILNKNGQNLTNTDYLQYIAPMQANLAFTNLKQVSYIAQGNAKALHQAYVVFDPNCIFCHRLYNALQPFISSGQLAVRWIPVAFLKPTSAGKVYAILNSSNPAAALAVNEASFNEQSEIGGIPPLQQPNADLQAQLNNNMTFLKNSQLTTTPVLFYRTQQGQMRLLNGFQDSQQLTHLLPTIGTSFN